MSEQAITNEICIIIGASHAGVNCAFALRKEGWQGDILMYDTDPTLPYHRPPLSKAYLTSEDDIEKNQLKSLDSYEKENIKLNLGVTVKAINRIEKSISLNDGSNQSYSKLVIATGARPIIPPIQGIDTAQNIFPIRTAADAVNIRNTIRESKAKQVVVIGGGYIGLEAAASLKKLGAEVIVLEREDRILARVTTPEMSHFFQSLHTENGVSIFTNKEVISIETIDGQNQVQCADGSRYAANMIVIGVGIHVNTALAEAAGLEIKNGIRVDATTRTNDENIYAIGDCTFHHNPHYDCYIRLESVQNAVDQAKVAAATICGKPSIYNAIPWFWSDQFDVKLQMVGLSNGHNKVIVRKEEGRKNCFSVWYFKDDILLAVDAVNNGKAYVLGTKFIKNKRKVDKAKLSDIAIPFKPANLVL